MSNQNPSSEQGEISLIVILSFLKDTYKTGLAFGMMGIVAAIIYLVIAPKQYLATAQIAMAQIGATNNNNLNPLVVNIEEPSLLIVRLAQSTSFPAQVLSACGMEDNKNAALVLSKAIKVTLPKGVANMVELKMLSSSPQLAGACAQAIFELIKETQAQLVAPYLEAVRIKLADDEERLAKAREEVAKANKYGSSVGVVYLSTRDEIRFLLGEIATLKNIIISYQSKATRLIAPIYTSEVPIAPNKQIVLVSGLLGGFFAGLLLAWARLMWVRLKSDLQGQKQEML